MSKPVTLPRLAAYLATLPGLDHSLMLIQYSTPVVIALLLRLARLRARFTSSKVTPPGVTKGLAALGASIGEARVIMRIWGLVPIINGLRQMFPALTRPHALLAGKGLSSLIQTAKAKPVQTLQLLSLLCYYPLEHAAYLASKGVLPLGAQRAGKASLWSVRFWAAYVMLTLYSLSKTRASLSERTKAIRAPITDATLPKSGVNASDAEGYELELEPALEKIEHDAEIAQRQVEKVELGKAWAGWKNSVLVNGAYAPLTLHWSTVGGLWTNPAITGMFGIIAAIGQIQAGWAKTA